MDKGWSGKDFTRARQVWVDQVGDDCELPAMAFKVAHHLSHYFNRDQFVDAGCLNAWPSYEALAGKVSCDASTIKRAINQLRERKHLETSGGRGRSQTLQYRAKIKPRVVKSEGLNGSNKTMQNCPINEEKEVKSASEKRSNLHEKGGGNDLQPLLNKILDKNARACERENPVTTIPYQAMEDQCEPYNPQWALVVFDLLSRGPCSLPRPATAFLRDQIEKHGNRSMFLSHQANYGWPDINSMFDWPKVLDLASVPPAIRKMALEMEPVTAASALWIEWREAFAAKGWPFPSEAKRMSFPLGGPDALDAFMQRLVEARDQTPDNVVALVNGNGGGG